MALISFTVVTDFFENLEAMVRGKTQDLPSALYREAEREMTMAKRLTPVDTGTLRASGRVEGPVQQDSHTVTFRMAYGGPAIEYALRIHEDLLMHHAVGQAKFLEQPVREEVGSGRAGARILQDMQQRKPF